MINSRLEFYSQEVTINPGDMCTCNYMYQRFHKLQNLERFPLKSQNVTFTKYRIKEDKIMISYSDYL